ncbi:NADH:ubiquinone oxidoreductase [Alistipes sp. OttesenSCG-928-L06]|nr:NADH:ubiquinone oxidoreductase [Alistipes sp. OttesenSCG-928-L06]
MFANKISVLIHHGQQAIPDLDAVVLPEIFRGRPVIQPGLPEKEAETLKNLCPTKAIGTNPLSIDLGKCAFCGECQLRQPAHIRFTNDWRLATTRREALIVREGEDRPIAFHAENVRPEIPKLFHNVLKLRQVSAGGDNSCEMELNASGNVNFDLGRYGVEFTASPRHGDGLVITGPITENMAIPLEIAYNATPDPKVVVLVGADAISGGLFADSPALDRRFTERHHIDLYIPGNPTHPLTYIDGILTLIGRREARS